MAYKIVKVDEDSPAKIFQFRLSQFKGHLTKNFLDMIIRPIQGPGIYRNNYYILRTDVVYQFTQQTVESTILMAMLLTCNNRGCKLLMILDK